MEPHCDTFNELIDDALDAFLERGIAPPENLRRHLNSCGDCGRSWEQISALHRMLKDQPAIEVPANFTHRTMARLNTWMLSRPAWQLAALQLAAILTGVAAVVAALGLLGSGQGTPMPAPVWVAAAAQLMRSAGSVSAALVASLVESRWVALSYPFIAVMLAAIWFLALFGPRLLFKSDRGRAS
ncbi:MAG: hypothetical protein ACH37Z_06515 [Anaerolineae bacterium]|jgi:predicted anti-sigma-YlaC factor YlaD|nr:hypothetical protein [Ardenticatenia bacterium]HQZ70137.1 hypothetical protein [Anaerolineae bacterium]HRA20339.1 hypothetical protein [Anaerolineae bacterium]